MKCTRAVFGDLRLWVALAAIIVLLMAAACTDSPATGEQVPRITVQELYQKLESGADVLVVDTREQKEYESGHIRGAIPVSFDSIEAGEWKPSKDNEIVFY